MQEAARIAAALPQTQIRARLLLQHEREILRTHARIEIPDHVIFAHEIHRDLARELGFLFRIDRRRIDALELERRLGAKGVRNRCDQFAQSLLDEVLRRWLERANRADDCRFARDDAHRPFVAGIDVAQADDGGVDRIDAATDDTLCGDDDVRGHDDGVDGDVRMRAMAAAAFDVDRHLVGRRHRWPGTQADLARGNARPVMQRVHLVGGEFIEESVLHHRAGTRIALFARLENQIHRAIEFSCLCEIARSAQQHRRVTVVSASVHPAG